MFQWKYPLWYSKNVVAEDCTWAESGLFVCDGREYGNGCGFLRMNLASRRELVREGLERLKKSIRAYQNQNAEK